VKAIKSVLIIMSFCLCFLLACTDKEKTVELTGTIAMKGNAPFLRVVFVSDAGRVYTVAVKEKDKLLPLQGKKIRIKATEKCLKMETADGKITTTEWYLQNIVLPDYPGQ